MKKSLKKNNNKPTSLKDLINEDFSKNEIDDIERDAKSLNLQIQLRDIRKKMKLTQVELAKKAKIPRTTISKIENNALNFTIGTIKKIADAMDMEVEINLIEKT